MTPSTPRGRRTTRNSLAAMEAAVSMQTTTNKSRAVFPPSPAATNNKTPTKSIATNDNHKEGGIIAGQLRSSGSMRSLAELFSPVKSISKLTSEVTASSSINSNKKRCSLNYNEEEAVAVDNDAPIIAAVDKSSKTTKKRLCLRPSTYTPPPRSKAPPPPSSSTTDAITSATLSTAKNQVTATSSGTEITPTWRINVGSLKTSPITTTLNNNNKRKCADCAVGITIGDNCMKCNKLNEMIIEQQVTNDKKKKIIGEESEKLEAGEEVSVKLKADEVKEKQGVGVVEEVIAQTPASMKSKGSSSEVARSSNARVISSTSTITQEGAATNNSVKKSPLFSMTAGVVVTNSRTRNSNRTSAAIIGNNNNNNVPSSPSTNTSGNNGGLAVVATRTSPRRLKSFNPPPTPRYTDEFTTTTGTQQPPPCTTPRTSNNSSSGIMAHPNSLQTPRTPGGSHPYAKMMGILSHPNSLQTPPRTPRTPGMDELALFNWGPDELGAAQSWEEDLLLGGATTDPSSSMAGGSLRNVSSIMSPGGLMSRKNTVTFAPLKTEEEEEGALGLVALESPGKISLGKRGKAGKSLDLLAASAERKKKAATPIKKKKKKKRSVNFDSDEDGDDHDSELDSDNDEEEYPSSKEDDDDYDPTPTKKKSGGTTRIKIKATTTASKKKRSPSPVAAATKKKKGRSKGAKTQKLVKKQRYVKSGSSEKISRTVKAMAPPTYAGVSKKALKNDKSFSLHREGDEEHINQVHILVRRDIWEGFVVGGNEKSGSKDESRSESRLFRYNNTVGFRCKWCKHAKPSERVDKAAVYPRRLDRIYLSNIRFQRDHIVQCPFISQEIKDEYIRLKQSKGLTRGKKAYWITAAEERGLCDSEEGITFNKKFKDFKV